MVAQARWSAAAAVLLVAGCMAGPLAPSPDRPAPEPPAELSFGGAACAYWTFSGPEDADAVASMLPPGVRHRLLAGFLYVLACDDLAIGGAPAARGAFAVVGTHVESPERDNGDYVLWAYTDREDVRAALSAMGLDIRPANVSIDTSEPEKIRLAVRAADDWVEAEGTAAPERCAGPPTPFFTEWANGPTRWLRWNATMLAGACLAPPTPVILHAMPGGALARRAGGEDQLTMLAHGRTGVSSAFRVVEGHAQR